ncbi:MAG: putative transporter [Chitinophagaceae bacterium]|nr:putative transporter [Chitinophagaceae bacterium]
MFQFLKDLLYPTADPTTAQTIVFVAAAVTGGVLLGRLKVAKVGIGAAGVLFVGLLMGHLGYGLHTETMHYIRDFGLILFVYAVGLQVGPSFFASLKKDGLVMNGIAVTAVFISFLVAWIIMRSTGTTAENMAGIMTGAVTNTPSLGAAKSVLKEVAAVKQGTYADPANGYAIAYPFGAVGEILLIILFMKIFKVKVKDEQQRFEEKRQKDYPHPSVVKCRVTNPNAFGKTLGELLNKESLKDVIVTRIKCSGTTKVSTPTADTVLKERDVLMLVGLPDDVDVVVTMLGRVSTDNFITSDEEIESRDITVTKNNATQKSLAQLNMESAYGVKVTRIFRGGMELIATRDFVVHMGDTLRVVGPVSELKSAEQFLGNSRHRLAEPELATIFVGIILGLILGSIPLAIPGLPVPVKLGIAAGPLLVAIFISRYGGVAHLHSYMNQSAAWFMRDFGIALFFAAVGINAGKTLYESFMANNGWWWLLYGMAITSIPVIFIALVGRLVFKINFLQIAGMIGGTYTSPPTLAFCNGYFKGDVPAQAYATVYPLVTIARILAAQLFILLFLQ